MKLMQMKFLAVAILVVFTATMFMVQAMSTNAYAAVASSGKCYGTCAIAVAFGNFAKALACAGGYCISAGGR
jgi:hypothetical protein